MTIGILRVELFISSSNSLKHKRTVVKALKDRIKNTFNVSVSEVEDQDKWQKCTLGLSAVGTDKKYVNAMLDKVLDFIRRSHETQILDYQMEIM